jgi:hypothetical protein
MSISRVLATLLVAAAVEGCARSAAEPATRGAAAAAPAVAAPAAGRPASPDPGEQITPAELATIPEPVPASPDNPGAPTPRQQIRTLQKAPEGDSGRTEEGPKAKGSLWRVQVFATQDRDLAERTAREATQLLHVEARVEYEASRYKVRLGDFGSEEEAGALRDEAVRAGYPGAFRIRCTPDTTLNKD